MPTLARSAPNVFCKISIALTAAQRPAYVQRGFCGGFAPHKPLIHFPHMPVGYMSVDTGGNRRVLDLQRNALLSPGVGSVTCLRIEPAAVAALVPAWPRRLPVAPRLIAGRSC